MILIISKEKLDPTTELVMDWIHMMGKEVFRINGNDFYHKDNLTIALGNDTDVFSVQRKPAFEKSGYTYNVAWMRRWSDVDYLPLIQFHGLDNPNYSMVERIMRSDEAEIRNYFFSCLKVKKWLTLPARSSLSKMAVLRAAIAVGFDVPDTLICSDKATLSAFREKHGRIITKDIIYPYNFANKDAMIYSLTREIGDAEMKMIPDSFTPSLFQPLIEKAYELRVFYLDGQCYTMAIFSQADQQTAVDFRDYNNEKPNRNVPFRLPEQVAQKVHTLMQQLQLNTGSLDIIRDKNGRYVFLEVNPVGQFGMTSGPCNYYLEKKVAEFLVQNDQ